MPELVPSTKPLDEDVALVLRAATVSDNIVKLNSGKLDPKLYKRVDAILKASGGSWKSAKQGHVYKSREAAEIALEQLVDLAFEPIRNPLGFFATPSHVAQQMVQLAELPFRCNVLEPSAGYGAIVKEILLDSSESTVTAIEFDAERELYLRQELGLKNGLRLGSVCRDFLGADDRSYPDGFSRIVMNPPFAVRGPAGTDRHAYITHIKHAFCNFLQPGGILVSVCPTGFLHSETNKLREFRMFVQSLGEIYPLPSGTFYASKTMCETVLIRVRKSPIPAI
jgi:tRNA1(Val) A37 N6-methylase TrmN6